MCVPNKSSDFKKLSKYQSRGSQQRLKHTEAGGAKSPPLYKGVRHYDDKFKDSLSIATDYTRTCFDYIEAVYKKWQQSRAFKILFGTTQPAHVIMIVAVATVAYLYTPSASSVIDHHRNQQSQSAPPTTSPPLPPHSLAKFVYFGAFCAYLGSQFWMTFVSGLALYFNLPRHHFGDVQRVLFPKYFALNTLLTFVILVIFMRANSAGDGRLYQTIALAASFIINLSIRLYLTPPLLQLIETKNKMEAAVGVGMEVGAADVGPLRHCPHYTRIHRTFRRVHMSIAIGNIVTMGCTVFHLYYLSQSICVL